jgi:hypothetical protein
MPQADGSLLPAFVLLRGGELGMSDVVYSYS